MKIKTDFLLPALVLFSSNSSALDLLFKPDFSFKERYDDNVRMQVNPKNSNLISTISPGLMMGYLADDNELRTKFKWNELIYSEDSELDFSEKVANVNHLFQRDWFRTDLGASYAEESSINTQLDLSGSGNLQFLIPRTTKSVDPSITFNLSETNSLQLGFSYLDVTYKRQANLSVNRYYSDYSNQQFSATFTHIYSERLSFNFTGAYSEFDSPSTSSVGVAERAQLFGVVFPIFPRLEPGKTESSQIQKTQFYQIGTQYAYDEKTQISLAAGIRNINSEFSSRTIFDNPVFLPTESSQSSSTSGKVYSANLTRNFEQGTLNLSATQQLNPASTGTQQQTTSFSARGRYNLDERWSTGLSASYLISKSVTNFNGSSAANNRNYATLSPNIQWRWTPEINLDLSYTYRQQVYESLNQTAIGDSVQLQFSYQPQINRQVK
jgi:hypothetical protein